MKVLITGATGFIGKHLVKKLLDENIAIIVIKHPEDTTELPNPIISYVLNYRDVEKDIQFLKKQKIDGVIHLASLFLVSHNSADIKSLIDTNLFFSTYVLECSVKANIKWFINTGTFWQNFNDKDYSPVNLYAATKQAFQDIAQYYVETGEIKFVTIKLSDTYGPNDTRSKILTLLLKVSQNGETLNLSPGDQIIDITHVYDVVAAYNHLLKLLVDKNVISGSVFSLSSLQRFTLKEIVGIFEEVAQKKIPVNWGAIRYREREVMEPWTRGEKLPGFECKISLRQGIKELLSNQSKIV